MRRADPNALFVKMSAKVAWMLVRRGAAPSAIVPDLVQAGALGILEAIAAGQLDRQALYRAALRYEVHAIRGERSRGFGRAGQSKLAPNTLSFDTPASDDGRAIGETLAADSMGQAERIELIELTVIVDREARKLIRRRGLREIQTGSEQIPLMPTHARIDDPCEALLGAPESSAIQELRTALRTAGVANE